MITVYTLPICSNCDAFKLLLKQNNIDYTVRDLEDDDIRMELLMNSVTLIKVPIVEINGNYYDMNSALKELKLWSE
jgi:glutaredoxin